MQYVPILKSDGHVDSIMITQENEFKFLDKQVKILKLKVENNLSMIHNREVVIKDINPAHLNETNTKFFVTNAFSQLLSYLLTQYIIEIFMAIYCTYIYVIFIEDMTSCENSCGGK